MLKKLIFVAGLISFCSCSGGGLPKDGEGEKTYVLDSQTLQEFQDGKPYHDGIFKKLDGSDELFRQNIRYGIKMSRVGDKLLAEKIVEYKDIMGKARKNISKMFDINIREQGSDGTTLKGDGTKYFVDSDYNQRSKSIKLFEISFVRDSVFIKVDGDPQDKDRFVSLYKAH